MADTSLPQPQSYYRIAVRNPEMYTGTMYYNHVDPFELEEKLGEIRAAHPSNLVEKVEYIEVSVSVRDVTWLAD